MGSWVTSSPNTQTRTRCAKEPQKDFKTENSSGNLNGEKQNKGRKGGGGLSPFLLLLGLYSWCEEKVSRSERLGMCELRGVEREQWLRFPEEARQGLRKPPRLIYH